MTERSERTVKRSAEARRANGVSEEFRPSASDKLISKSDLVQIR